MFYISTQRPTLCSHSSSQIPIVHSPLQWNALLYIGKFDSQAAFGIYGLATTCGHNNTNQTLQPVCLNINTAHTLYNAAMAALRLRLIYGCGQSMVTVNLRLRPICGCGQSTYYGLSAHYSYSSAIFRLYALSECNFSSIVYLQ